MAISILYKSKAWDVHLGSRPWSGWISHLGEELVCGLQYRLTGFGREGVGPGDGVCSTLMMVRYSTRGGIIVRLRLIDSDGQIGDERKRRR